jgi:hypothetical protein
MAQKRRKFVPVSKKKAGMIGFDYAFWIGQNSMIKKQ